MEGVTKLESFWEESPHLTHSSGNGGGSLVGMTQSSPSHTTNSTSHLHYERNLNFSTVTVEDNEYGFHKKKSARDPLSHRIIEKRRRDRMNNCLADLARLLPQASLRKGRGRIEKTEIVELAIKHLKHLQHHPCPLGENCEFRPLARPLDSYTPLHQPASSSSPQPSSVPGEAEGQASRHLSHKSDELEQYKLGYQECLQETMHFLLQRKGTLPGDTFYLQLVEHLNRTALLVNDKVARAYSRDPIPISQEDGCSDGESDSHNSKKNNDGRENEDVLYKMPVIGGHVGGRRRSDLHDLPGESQCHFSSRDEFEGDNNSCSSTPLSLDMSDAVSYDGKTHTGSNVKPPVPTVIGGHSSSGSPAMLSYSNGRSSDERSESASSNRYKFKSTIKQRFTADLETAPETAVRHKHQRCPTHFSPPKATQDEESPSEELHMDDVPEGCRGASPIDDQKPDLSRLAQIQGQKWLSITNDFSQIDKGIVNGKGQASLSGHRDKHEMDTKFRKTHHQEWNVEPRRGVPAFALHESGLFYVPLTLDREFVSPYSQPLDSGIPNPPLHPITISVCFQMKDAGNSALRGQSHPAQVKLPDLTTVQRGSSFEALNLSKLSYAPPPVTESLRISPNSVPPVFGNQRFQRHCPSDAGDTSESDRESFPALNGRDPSSSDKSSPLLFLPYDLHSRQIYAQNLQPNDLTRPARKRHLASRQSPSSSSLSGYQCWRDNQGVTGVSTDDPNDLSYKSATDEVMHLVKGEKFDISKTYGNSGVKMQRNGASPIPKRQRKSMSPRDETNSF